MISVHIRAVPVGMSGKSRCSSQRWNWLVTVSVYVWFVGRFWAGNAISVSTAAQFTRQVFASMDYFKYFASSIGSIECFQLGNACNWHVILQNSHPRLWIRTGCNAKWGKKTCTQFRWNGSGENIHLIDSDVYRGRKLKFIELPNSNLSIAQLFTRSERVGPSKPEREEKRVCVGFELNAKLFKWQ